MALDNFEHAFAAETLGKLDRNNWNRLIRALNLRLIRLEEVLPTLEIAEDALVASGLARLNELLEPALIRAEAFSSGSFLVATTSTSILPVVGELQTVYLDAGVQLQAFIPTAFLVLTRDADPDAWALVRLFDYKKTNGELMFRTVLVNGVNFPYNDWRIVASASEPLAVHNWAETTEANALATSNSASNAAQAADDAENALIDFTARYLGAFGSNPSEGNNGQPLATGMLYWNTNVQALRVYNGEASPPVWATYKSATVTAAAFADLLDCPNSYLNQDGKFPRVKSSEDGLEFVEGITREEADAHFNSTLNPHSTTATQVGLENVTNDAQLKRSGNDWAAFTTKTVPVDADIMLIEDSASAGLKKTMALSNLKSALNYESSNAAIMKTNVAAQVSGMAEKTTPVDNDVAMLEDSAASFGKRKFTWSNLKVTLKAYFDTVYPPIGDMTITEINTQATSYTLVLGDEGKTVEMNSGSANNLTVPPDSVVAFPIGTYINVTQLGAGQTTIVPGVGVTIRSRVGMKLADQYAMATIYKRGTDEWLLGGDVEP